MIAASFSIDKMLDINENDGLVTVIDALNDNIRQRTEATAAVAIVSGVVIPLGILMIVLRLFKISLGALSRIIVVVVCTIHLLCCMYSAIDISDRSIILYLGSLACTPCRLWVWCGRSPGSHHC